MECVSFIDEGSVTPEAKVKKKVKQQLDALGAYYFSPQSGIYGRSGIPDIVGCLNGRFFAIETKAGRNEATALQEKELKKIQDAGGVALIINEENIGSLDASSVLGYGNLLR